MTFLLNFLWTPFLWANAAKSSIATGNQSLSTANIYSTVPAYAYESFDASKYGLNKTVFEKAIKGYNKLIDKGLIKNKRYLTICDMSLSSKKKRLFILDLTKKKVVYNLRVSHGQASGEEYANNFGNEEDSHKTSLGFYTTGGAYEGENGQSMKLNGLESGFNDNAFNRAIVVHGSEYVTDEYFKDNNRIGRSWGCPAISMKSIKTVVNTIKNCSCFFVYHTNTTYHKKSKLVK
jgi:L,D-transpeptidase catalytic domain